MQSIFKITRERLETYSGVKPTLYGNVTGDTKNMWGKVTSAPEKIKTLWQTKNKIKSLIGK